jgi:GAF domain-containing protein/HAMP domain-containing protein
VETPSPKNTRLRIILGSLSLRTKLILGNMLIIVIAIIGTGYYVYSRTREANTYLTDQLDKNVLQQAEDKLNATSIEQATALDNFFVSLRKDTTTIGATTENLLSQEATLNSGVYWNASQSLTRLSNGSWDNSNTELGSVFIPAKNDLTNSLVSELNTIKQLDFTVPIILKKNPETIAIYFGGNSGETLYYPNINLASIVPPDFDVTGRPWFVMAAQAQNPGRGTVWSDPYLDAALHGLIVTSSIPVFDSGGNFRGVLAMDIQLNRITDLVSNIHVGETGYAILIDRNKRLIAMPDAGYQDFGITPGIVPLGEILDSVKLANAPAGFFDVLAKTALGETGLGTITLGGFERLVVYRPVPEVGYGLVIIVPSKELLADAIAARQQTTQATASTVTRSIFLVGAILVIALIATIGIGNGLTFPLRALTKTAEGITSGNLDAEAKVQGQDEIGTLAKAFNAMIAQMRNMIGNLEIRVAERTRALEQRNITMQTVIEAASLASQVKSENKLIEQSIQLLAEHLRLDHVGIYLASESEEFVTLIATNNSEGKTQLAGGNQLSIFHDEATFIYSAADMLRYQVGDQRYYLSRPIQLSDTKTNLSFPLVSGQRLLGLMNIQTISPDPQYVDQQALQTFADQIALSIVNIRLVEQLQGRIKEVSQLAGQTVQGAWEQLRGGGTLGYHYDRLQVLPASEVFPLEANRQLLAGKSATYVTPDRNPRARLIAPIILRGNVIGVIGYDNNDPRYGWLADEITLLETIASRVSLALENTRLVADAQQRAERERTLGQAAARMRETLDIDVVLQTAVREMRNSLGLKQAEVRLHVDEPKPETKQRTKYKGAGK